MLSQHTLDQATLKYWLRYNRRTGIFTWRRKPSMAVNVGDVAGASHNGYVRIKVSGPKIHRAHRLAWLWVYGRWPDGHLDHKDGNRANNAIRNLREVTRTVNQQNWCTAKGYYAYRGKFCVQIDANGVRHFIGLFNTEAEARAAYLKHKRALHKGWIEK